MNTCLITGGAGFVGSSIATLMKKHYEAMKVIALTLSAADQN